MPSVVPQCPKLHYSEGGLCVPCPDCDPASPLYKMLSGIEKHHRTYFCKSHTECSVGNIPRPPIPPTPPDGGGTTWPTSSPLATDGVDLWKIVVAASAVLAVVVVLLLVLLVLYKCQPRFRNFISRYWSHVKASAAHLSRQVSADDRPEAETPLNGLTGSNSVDSGNATNDDTSDDDEAQGDRVQEPRGSRPYSPPEVIEPPLATDG